MVFAFPLKRFLVFWCWKTAPAALPTGNFRFFLDNYIDFKCSRKSWCWKKEKYKNVPFTFKWQLFNSPSKYNFYGWLKKKKSKFYFSLKNISIDIWNLLLRKWKYITWKIIYKKQESTVINILTPNPHVFVTTAVTVIPPMFIANSHQHNQSTMTIGN